VLLLLGKLRRLAPAALALAAGFTFSLVLVDVDEFIVDRNAGRYAVSGELDVAYLKTLSDDAVPRLAALVPLTTGDARLDLLAGLACRRHALERAERALGWPSEHFSRSRALASLGAIDAELDGFPVYLDYHGPVDPDWASYVVKTADAFEPCRGAFFE
jgi:hypothetical protein